MRKPLVAMPHDATKPCCRNAHGPVVGIDEVGRGCLAGPVYAAAVVFHDVNDVPLGINDSKKVREDVREMLYPQILEKAHVGIGFATVAEIDEINILNAALLAMRRAYDALPEFVGRVIVDGDKDPGFGDGVRVIAMNEADSICQSVAAASIMAKVARDRVMRDLAGEDDPYRWLTNKGYGTNAHMIAIERHGITEHHRRSFAPVKRAMKAIAATI